MDNTTLSALLHNAALLLALVVVFDLASSRHIHLGQRMRQVFLGLILGGIGIGVILAAFRLEPGIVFDARSVLLAVSGLFLGTIPTVIAMGITAVYRVTQGGTAAWVGAAVVLTSGSLGIAWRHWRKGPLEDISWRELYGLGVVVHLVMLALMLALPWASAQRVLTAITLPVLLIFPATTAALGAFLANRRRRERLDTELAESETRYRSLFENDYVVMLILNPADGNIVDANPAACRFYGWTRQQLQTMRITQINILPPEKMHLELERARAAQSYQAQVAHRRADGSIREVEIFGGTIRIQGRPLFYSIIHDITERKQTAEALHREQEFTRTLLDNLADGVVACDATGKLVLFNRMAREWHGMDALALPPEEWGQHYNLYGPDGTTPLPTEAIPLRRAFHGETVHDAGMAIIAKGLPARYILAAAGPFFDARHNLLGAVAVMQDITDRKQAEEALRASENKFRTLVENIPQKIFLKDREGRYVSLNEHFARDLHVPSEAAVGKTDYDFFPKELADKYRADDARIMRTGQSDSFEEKYPQGGSEIWIHTVKTPVRDEQGEIIGVFGIFWDITKAKQAEVELHRTQAILQAAMDQSTAGIAIADAPSGTLRYVNDAGLLIRGRDRQTVVNGVGIHQYVATWQLLDFDGRPLNAEEVPLARAIMFGETNSREFIIRRANDDDRIVLAKAAPIRDDVGTVVAGIVVFIDTTEAKRAEAALLEKEKQYRSLIENLPAGIVVHAPDTAILLSNPMASSLLGLTGDQMRGKIALDPAWCFLREDGTTMPVAEYPVDRVVLSGEPILNQIVGINRPDLAEPNWVLCNAYPVRDPNGHLLQIVVSFVDITKRKRMEKSLRESETRFRSLLQDVQFVAVQGYGPDGTTRYWNHASEQLYGYSAQEAIGCNLVNLIIPPEMREGVAQAVRQMAETGQPIPASELSLMRKDGSRVEVFSSHVIVKVPGWPQELFCIDIDLTERKRLEQERVNLEAHLRQQQKLESIGTLASGVAHEINNPINGVMNYAQLILDRAEANSQAQEYAREIIHETNRVATIVRNLLQFARQEKQAHSPARIEDVVDQTLSLIRTVIRRDQITLHVEVPPDLPMIKCRSQQIQQVLMNLLTNARDALNQRYPAHHEDKVVRVEAAYFERDGRRWVRLMVEDHGAGIPAEVQGRVFDPFFTTKSRSEGTGLGLSISHSIVKDHHGKMWFETEPGHGTKFHVELPVDNGWEVE